MNRIMYFHHTMREEWLESLFVGVGMIFLSSKKRAEVEDFE